MRKQSEGLTKEYDRLLEEHSKMQVSMPQPALLDGRPLCAEEATALLPQALQEALAVGTVPSLSLPLSLLLLSLGPAAFLWAGGMWPSRWQPLTKVGLASCPASVSSGLFPCMIPIPGLVSTPGLAPGLYSVGGCRVM